MTPNTPTPNRDDMTDDENPDFPSEEMEDAEQAEQLAAEDGEAPDAQSDLVDSAHAELIRQPGDHDPEDPDLTESDMSDPSDPSDIAPDPEEAELAELDRRSRQGGEHLELVQQLEFIEPAKGRRTKATREAEADEAINLTSVAEARSIVEAYLFTTNEPLSVARLSRLMNNLHPRTVRGLLLQLQIEYDERAGGLQIVEVAGGFQMATRPHYAEWLLRLHRHRRRSPLTPATLETLAIVAYKQPVTKAELETVRGVESTAPLRTLQEIGLIEVGGRREVIGRPQLYVSTDLFLKTFALKSLAELPTISELKHLFAEEQKIQVKSAAEATPPPPPTEPEAAENNPDGEENDNETGEDVDKTVTDPHPDEVESSDDPDLDDDFDETN
ncbi:SMC-Scp complex subunit ScpB [candidate division BRC1 bacterium HGW-BRC1-1]|jgi:segregation and condensation protein B|nr:MAG: SMC-Scp complex subunit ScpB [candidate division BRC1 bacterium HGW-BRC1-1]